MAANRDEVLLERLQKTIDTWSTEVTSAQETLAQQIGDARTQLHTLIGALNKRTHVNGNGGATTIRAEGLAERDAALREAMARNRDLEARLRRIEEERRAPAQDFEKLRTEVLELRGQIDAYRAQEHDAALLIERAEKELAAMRRSSEMAAAARQSAVDEVQRLRESADIISRERDGFEAETKQLRHQLDERMATNRLLESEIASLTSIVHSLEADLAAARATQSTRLAEMEAELARATRALADQEQRLTAGRDERTRLHEGLASAEAELNRLIARGEEREAAHAAAMREADELRQSTQDRGQIEAELRAEVQSLRDTVATLRRSGEELDSDLRALKEEYDRQADTLAETVREIEAHWELARQGEERERQLQGSLTELQRLHSDAQSELAALRDRALLADSNTSAPQPTEAESEGLQRLLAFEQILIEREDAVEAAAERMRRLEDTAVRLQSEVAAMQTKREPAPVADTRELDAARTEAAQLKQRVADLEGIVRQLRTAAERPAAPAFVSSAPVPEAIISTRPAFTAHTAAGQKKSMGEILVESGIISGQQLESALEEQRTAKKRRLGSILVEKGLIREEMVAQVVAAQLNLTFVRLGETPIQRGAVALLDGRLATHHMCFPIAATTAEVTIAMANPLDLIAIEDLEFATHLKVKPVVATLSDITSAIVEHYGVTIANAIAEDHFDVQSPPMRPLRGQPAREV